MKAQRAVAAVAAKKSMTNVRLTIADVGAARGGGRSQQCWTSADRLAPPAH